ncbi:MAG: alpha-D-ribose 1-methylphosphonate 5-triphosphate diphosphatase [Alphaproteobacteria bacterium]|nr:alpha-D-ribose 1-methylphosphonate 5-triphosphate diphosphatase [Alphaproteobacteria bacterium]
MMSELVVTNALVVTAEDSFRGTICVKDGKIAALDTGKSNLPSVWDADGDMVLPGLVELHTDNLERHVSPRPGVKWETVPAIIAHDVELVAAGITTVLDALRVGDRKHEDSVSEVVAETAAAIHDSQQKARFRAGHLLHIRCELADEHVIEGFEALGDHPLIKLVSLMDHTPGQRQFANLDQWRRYYGGKYKLSDAEMDALIARKQAVSEKFSAKHRQMLAAHCHDKGYVLASHDDATEAHVDEAAALGIRISEFPTTGEAADAAVRHGMRTIAGAPNVVRGGSHSGNISAGQLAEDELLDALSSDYIPSSLLHGALLLHKRHGIALPQAINKVSRNPAEMVGLSDRGEIAEGKRADLIQVRTVDDTAAVVRVWRAGACVL